RPKHARSAPEIRDSPDLPDQKTPAAPRRPFPRVRKPASKDLFRPACGRAARVCKPAAAPPPVRGRAAKATPDGAEKAHSDAREFSEARQNSFRHPPTASLSHQQGWRQSYFSAMTYVTCRITFSFRAPSTRRQPPRPISTNSRANSTSIAASAIRVEIAAAGG